MRVTGTDYTRLGERADDLVDFDGHQAHMRMEGGHCAALVAAPETQEYYCTAYATRPEICRDLARGSPECAAERAHKSERPGRFAEMKRWIG